MVADIAGFWTPRWAPLAGASYRSVITDALDAAVEESEPGPITLVGHSQGSVICAWYVSRLDRSQDRITLFTCGSPLRSLYSTFFPEYFGHEFFESVAATSKAGQWYNYWRLTDPIATALPDAHNRDLTERADQPLRGHGEYWQEPLMRADVDGVLGVGVAERSVPLEPA
jgi:pimeloyl-ACP methyl ester carboxylesterase